MNKYESVIIINPEVDEAGLKALQEKFTGLINENGKVEPFLLRPISAATDEKIRENCTTQNLKDKDNPIKFDSNKYARKMVISTVVEPNLHSQELQDSYGCMGADDLVTTMLLPGEYAKLQQKVQEINGFKTFDELEEEVKNE